MNAPAPVRVWLITNDVGSHSDWGVETVAVHATRAGAEAATLAMIAQIKGRDGFTRNGRVYDPVVPSFVRTDDPKDESISWEWVAEENLYRVHSMELGS